MALSVNISHYERQQIVNNAQAAYFKTAGNTDPDVNLRKVITAKIYIDQLEHVAETVPEEAFKYMQYIPQNNVDYKLNYLSFDEDYAIKNASDSGSALIQSTNRLAEVSFEDLNIPSKFIHGDRVLFPFEEFGKDINIKLSDSIKSKITAHNTKIDELLGDMDASLKNLVASINMCKTTKSYEATLPGLTSLYPKQLLLKIAKKNEVEEVEMSEHDKLLRKASVVIATSKLMED